jgi:hypothetical protein
MRAACRSRKENRRLTFRRANRQGVSRQQGARLLVARVRMRARRCSCPHLLTREPATAGALSRAACRTCPGASPGAPRSQPFPVRRGPSQCRSRHAPRESCLSRGRRCWLLQPHDGSMLRHADAAAAVRAVSTLRPPLLQPHDGSTLRRVAAAAGCCSLTTGRRCCTRPPLLQPHDGSMLLHAAAAAAVRDVSTLRHVAAAAGCCSHTTGRCCCTRPPLLQSATCRRCGTWPPLLAAAATRWVDAAARGRRCCSPRRVDAAARGRRCCSPHRSTLRPHHRAADVPRHHDVADRHIDAALARRCVADSGARAGWGTVGSRP